MQRVKAVNFDVSKKTHKMNWLPQQRTLCYCKTYVSLIILTHISTKAKSLVKISLELAEIFGGICRIFAISSKKVQLLPS